MRPTVECYLCHDGFETTAENTSVENPICLQCYLRINNGPFAFFTRPGQACYCPICQRWMSGGERGEHMLQHTEPETAQRIEMELGITVVDFVGFCMQNNLDIDGRAPDDPEVNRAIRYWIAGGDAASEDAVDAIFGEEDEEEDDDEDIGERWMPMLKAWHARWQPWAKPRDVWWHEWG